MPSALMLSSALMLGAVGCGSDRVSATSEGQSTTQMGGTTDATESSGASETSTVTDTDDTVTSSPTNGASFYAGPDVDYGSQDECDAFAQDCPEGEKCVPYASTGGAWDANKCVDVTGNVPAGEPCTYGGNVEATDDCDYMSFCFNVVETPDNMLVGTCHSFCQGTPDEPVCPEGSACLIANDGTINACTFNCDPILQECGEGAACYWILDAFRCLFMADPAAAIGEPCDYLNHCELGSTCVATDTGVPGSPNVPDCGALGCCLAYCDLTMPDTCGVDLECAPFFVPGEEGPWNPNTGVCLPPAP